MVVCFSEMDEIPNWLQLPLLLNETTKCFHQIAANSPLKAARFCGWPTFWERSEWEVALNHNHDIDAWLKEFETALNKKLLVVKDVPGLIAPRIVAAIINEACYGLEAGISSEDDIDTAMKLGTNYPMGPNEWCSKIGRHNVAALLQQIALDEPCYQPHPLLLKQYI